MFVEALRLVLEHTHILDFEDYVRLKQVNKVMREYMHGVKFREFSLTELDYILHMTFRNCKHYQCVNYEQAKRNFLLNKHNVDLVRRYVELYGI